MDKTQVAKLVIDTVLAQDDLGGRVWSPDGARGPVRVYVCQIHPRKGAIDLGYLEIVEGVGPATVLFKLDKWEVKITDLLAPVLAGVAVESAGPRSAPAVTEDEDGNPLRPTVRDFAGDE